MKIPPRIDEAIVASVDYSSEMENQAMTAAAALVACGDGYLPEDTSFEGVGSAFRIPVLLPEGIPTGDEREFEVGSTEVRDLPIPLYWQILTDDGHKGSAIVGRIDYVERIGETPETIEGDPESVEEIVGELMESDEEVSAPTKGWGNAYGVFDTGPYGREAERLVRGGFLRGVSADLDKFEGKVASPELALDEGDDGSDIIKNDKITVNKGRITAATLLGKPAFQECIIVLDEPILETALPIEDGMYEEALEDADSILAAMAASAAPVVPPRDWFRKPDLKSPTPITVTDDGRVFGHIASWQTSHIGLPGSRKPPRSYSNYAYFRTGVVRTDDGTDVPVGQLTLAGGHADLSASAELAVKHYDDTASAIADVAAGEDQFGIWVSGALRPEATPEQVRALRASAPSGDWRPINGRLELVAVCQVNVPGFPVARSMVAGGQITALVAAGAREMYELRNPLHEVQDRLQALEAIELGRIRAEAESRMKPFIDSRKAELATRAADARDRINQIKQARQAELSIQAENARSRINAIRNAK